jgi:hypothetical protein
VPTMLLLILMTSVFGTLSAFSPIYELVTI